MGQGESSGGGEGVGELQWSSEGVRGNISAPATMTIPHPCLFLPPLTKQSGEPCLRIWPILCTRFVTMARVVVGSGGSDILCC